MSTLSNWSRSARCFLPACASLLLLLSEARAQWATQNIPLVSGWNPVYLTVMPTPADCDAAFSPNGRILSVRQWAPPPVEAVQYDEATGATIPQSGSWLTWFPTNHPDRALLNLSLLSGGGAYLIQVSTGAQTAINIAGVPKVMTQEWQPRGQHFLGLPVFGTGISFNTFFAAAAPNILMDYAQGGELYSVLPSGLHQRIFTPATTTITPGVPYWVKAQQYSTYSGPISVKTDSSAGWLDFGRRLVPQYLEIKNVTGAARGVKLARVTSGTPPAGTAPLAGPVPLKFTVVSGESEALGRIYQALPATWTTQLAAGASVRLALLPDALGLTFTNTNAAFQSILEVTDDVSSAGVVRQRLGVRAMARLGAAAEAHGLWVGEATVTAVSRLKMLAFTPNPDTNYSVARPFTFRLLAHVDGSGNARLLQRVFVGTRTDPGTGVVVTDLMATETNVAAYKSQYPAAKVFRYASANFPFMAPAPLTNGLFAVPNQALRGGVVVGRDDSVNPFRHFYSPLHDNREQRAGDTIPYGEDMEVFTVQRNIELVFQGPDQVNADPRWGETVCGGVYKETVYGLGGSLDATNRAIRVEGRFTLQRASAVSTLIQ